MMKKLALVSAISLAASGQAIAAGYKIPENSINSMALSAAYVANAHGADAAYYNPAAMVYNAPGASLEADLTLVHLTSINLTSGALAPDSTKVENIPVPSFHYVSPAMGDFRFGLSAVVPVGLTKRWKGGVGAFAEEFTLETLELNPSVGYRVNDRFSVGAGVRVIYSDGVVRSNNGAGTSRDLTGDSFDFGYNLAVHFKATDRLALAATYRSKIDLTVEGDANLLVGGVFSYNGPADVEIPAPAALNLAAAYDINDRTTLEFVYERNYWSAYDQLDFNYASSINPIINGVFGTPLIKDWSDSNTYRIGLTHRVNPKWTVMAGFAYDETPVPKQFVGYELPDSDAKIFSFGAKYNYSDKLTVGAALLYDQKDELTIPPGVNAEASNTLLGGATFEDARAYLFTVGLEYKF
ncbi:OmpP1/FadL family transporter [Sedimenticola hydrogenitrophicus]|uniref:OmpP1/FadL family transporter n=1 Tax=Sedimenticola hydrogenitrophicus TaxID=2967975 RepID=UPI0023AFBBA9|nr:porin [Sedimenticola hydrogenitrophicus]